MNYAPIALFVFNRPEHTRHSLESLAQNSEFAESPLFIFCDGARNAAETDRVSETRKLVRSWPHPNKTIVERDVNWGLAKSIIHGVTQLCNSYGRVIVLEDDMVTSPYFLNYMNSALTDYEADERIISIHGYTYPIDGLPEAFFIKGASCWGWATWKRGWVLFETDGEKLYSKLIENKLMNRFNVHGAYPYQRMLRDQISGKNDSWAIRWYASALINQKLTLHPGRSLVYNTGMDGSGKHCDQYDGFNVRLSSTPINYYGVAVKENDLALKAWHKFLRSVRRDKILLHIVSFRRMFNFVSRRFSLR